jgi:hypothetical protein
MVGLLTFPLSLLADRIGRAAASPSWRLLEHRHLACGMTASLRPALGRAAGLWASARQPTAASGLAVVFTYFPRGLRADHQRLHGRRHLRLVLGLSLAARSPLRFGCAGAFAAAWR